MNPRHPVYIVSKGRAEKQLTSAALSRTGVPHYVVVEAADRPSYEALRTDLATILVLDPGYQDRYETCDELGDAKSRGPGPARNFAWDHALAGGAPWHWVMDDNIYRFVRFNRNLKTPVADGTIFRAMEDFAGRYENVAMAGPNYFMFAARKSGQHAPFNLNTRIYSCNLIRNDVPFRWRGRYNEDTILSLDLLKAGWCTILFNAFLQFKMTTQTMAGGNTAEFYAEEGTLPKSRMLEEVHPDVARVSWRFHRWHHVVDYARFARSNRLRLRPGVAVPDEPDEYGMVLERRDPRTGEWGRVDSPWYPWEEGR